MRKSAIIYSKLITKCENARTVGKPPPQIRTEFYDSKDNLISPTYLKNRRMKIIAAVRVVGIYAVAEVTPSIQLKVNDVNVVEMADRVEMDDRPQRQRLLA